MFRGAAAWLGGTVGGLRSPSTHSLSSLDNPQALQQALQAMALLMNDDIQSAEATLEEGNSSFHKLAQGVILFLKATLGFEPEIMREASEKLIETELSAERDRKRAQRDLHRHTTYPPGTEFALVHAEAQLMSAVVGVLSESIVDAMKAFYKLRRAYQTLESIQGMMPVERSPSMSSKENYRNEITDTKIHTDESHSALNKERIINKRRASTVSSINMDIMEPMDVFIHSGSHLCFGLLLVILSMIPPSLGRLLSIIGFRGDRAKGLKMLWKASKAENVHGAIATLALLNFYGNAQQFCDVLPEDDSHDATGYPWQRCYDALMTMRQRYPKSALWLLEEARMEAVNGRLETAIQMLTVPVHTQMRQVEALMVFEKAINSMFLHRHQVVADSFIKLTELNSWSHALYYYFAAISYVELYRENRDVASEKADEYAKKAELLLERTPSFMGKKRFMAQSLPLEVFADRKVKKWQARAREKTVRLVEGVGVSPVEEMIYFWNGYKRMNSGAFTKSLIALEWDKEKLEDDVVDERAIHLLLSSAVLRNMNETDRAKEYLQDLLTIDKTQLKGGLRDDWTAPTAHYEWAVILWHEHGAQKAIEARDWLQKAARWEAYELDTRIGLRVTTALDTINKFADGQMPQ